MPKAAEQANHSRMVASISDASANLDGLGNSCLLFCSHRKLRGGVNRNLPFRMQKRAIRQAEGVGSLP